MPSRHHDACSNCCRRQQRFRAPAEVAGPRVPVHADSAQAVGTASDRTRIALRRRNIEVSCMDSPLQKAADTRFAQALAAADARDPRDYYRDRLRDLKRVNPKGYAEAVAYYRDTLVPSIAEGGAEPLAAWREYGLLIARTTAPGRTMAVDGTGRARTYEPPGEPSDMILHLPHASRAPALLVGLPPELSDAQTATYDWLVVGRRAPRGA